MGSWSLAPCHQVWFIFGSSHFDYPNRLFVALGPDIQPYLDAFLPIIVAALKNHEDAALCTVCIGTIGDIARALQEKTVQYAAAFVSLLLESLQSQVMSRTVKIQVLACFGDVALSIGAEFAPYLDTAMTVLKQAGEIQPNPVSSLAFSNWSFNS
jgi:importin subunit beta-1